MAKPNPFAGKKAPPFGKGGGGKAPPFGKNPKAAASGPPVAMPFKRGGKVRGK